MVSLKEERDVKKFEKDKKSFDKSKNITEHNKKLVHRYIKTATQNRKKTENSPHSYNSLRYTIMKKILEDVWNNKDLETITHQDIEQFEEDLSLNKIKNTNSTIPKPYANSYKSKFGKIITEYFKYYFGRDKTSFDNLILNDFGNKILTVTCEKFKEKKILNYNEVSKIVKETSKISDAFYFACLFDGGFRIEEFLNITYEDITLKAGTKQDYFIFKVKVGTKTGKPRQVPLYSYTELVKRYLETLEDKGEIKPNTRLFPFTPQYCNKLIKKVVYDVLGREDFKQFHNHNLRHSSATHYALNVAKREASIYTRFGWVFGSPEAREYIQIMQARDEEDEKQFRETNIYEETKHFKEEINLLKDENKEIKKLYRTQEDKLLDVMVKQKELFEMLIMKNLEEQVSILKEKE
jgi:integrase